MSERIFPSISFFPKEITDAEWKTLEEKTGVVLSAGYRAHIQDLCEEFEGATIMQKSSVSPSEAQKVISATLSASVAARTMFIKFLEGNSAHKGAFQAMKIASQASGNPIGRGDLQECIDNLGVINRHLISAESKIRTGPGGRAGKVGRRDFFILARDIYQSATAGAAPTKPAIFIRELGRVIGMNDWTVGAIEQALKPSSARASAAPRAKRRRRSPKRK